MGPSKVDKPQKNTGGKKYLVYFHPSFRENMKMIHFDFWPCFFKWVGWNHHLVTLKSRGFVVSGSVAASDCGCQKDYIDIDRTGRRFLHRCSGLLWVVVEIRVQEIDCWTCVGQLKHVWKLVCETRRRPKLKLIEIPGKKIVALGVSGRGFLRAHIMQKGHLLGWVKLPYHHRVKSFLMGDSRMFHCLNGDWRIVTWELPTSS